MDSHKRFLVWIEMLSLLLIVVGALNWGLIGVFGFNLVQWLAKTVGWKGLETLVYVLVGLSALLHIVSRDYYLTFLGECAFPCGSLTPRVPEGADTEVEVLVEPNVNVIYWAAESGGRDLKNPWIAYQQLANAGVAKSDSNGFAVLKVRSPATYKVGALFKRTLAAHIHYRVCKYPGWLGRVETVKVLKSSSKKEKFEESEIEY